MSILLPFDTETTGFPDYKNPSYLAHQPHLVQLGAILIDDSKDDEIIKSLNVIVKPEGWEIEQGAIDTHGIAMERAMDEGIPECDALEEFMGMWVTSDLRIGHNESFDARIIRIAQYHSWEHVIVPKEPRDEVVFTDPSHQQMVDDWKEGEAYCTMRKSTNIVDLPPTAKMKASRFGNKKKAPTLQEAYEFFFKEQFDGAHDGFADAKACFMVYKAIKSHGSVKTKGSRIEGAALETVLDFGKHNGHQIEDIIEDDPKYIEWLIDEGVVSFDEEASELIAKKGIA